MRDAESMTYPCRDPGARDYSQFRRLQQHRKRRNVSLVRDPTTAATHFNPDSSSLLLMSSNRRIDLMETQCVSRIDDFVD